MNMSDKESLTKLCLSLIHNTTYRECFDMRIGSKLIHDYYCDMNKYERREMNKEDIAYELKKSASKFTLYDSHVGYDKLIYESLVDNIDFAFKNRNSKYFDGKSLKPNTADYLSACEVDAIVYWPFSCIRKIEDRKSFTKILIDMYVKIYHMSFSLKYLEGIYYFDELVEIEFLSSLHDAITNVNVHNDEKSYFFRGHSALNYLLVPAIFRNKNWLENEKNMYQELRIECPDSFNTCESHLDYLVKMQHYGLPTRLLDITRSLLVALYFACLDKQNLYGELIVLEVNKDEICYPQSDKIAMLSCLPLLSEEQQKAVYKYCTDHPNYSEPNNNDSMDRFLHEVRSEKPAFLKKIHTEDLLHNYIVTPLKTNLRIVKQSGAFLIFGLHDNDMQRLHDNICKLRLKKDGEDKKIAFIVKNKEQIIKDLELCSINKASLFPEIDKVAEYVKEKY